MKPETTNCWPQLILWWGWLGFGFKEVPPAFKFYYRKFLFLGPLEIRFRT